MCGLRYGVRCGLMRPGPAAPLLAQWLESGWPINGRKLLALVAKGQKLLRTISLLLIFFNYALRFTVWQLARKKGISMKHWQRFSTSKYLMCNHRIYLAVVQPISVSMYRTRKLISFSPESAAIHVNSIYYDLCCFILWCKSLEQLNMLVNVKYLLSDILVDLWIMPKRGDMRPIFI
jgi:hypothetical protein